MDETIQLINECNKSFFSERNLNKYPLKYEPLKSYLLYSDLHEDVNGVPVDDEELETKLFLEYSRYKSVKPNGKFAEMIRESNKDGLINSLFYILNEKLKCNRSIDDRIEELTSYLISSAIQKGIQLTTSEDENKDISDIDSLQFCKKCIDSLISKCIDSDKLEERHTEENSSVEELKIALNDLQLAHNFLTKKFEDDRVEYLSNIEKLNKTNKELSQQLTTNRVKLNEAEKTIENLKLQPPTPELLLPNSPLSNNGDTSPGQNVNEGSYSLKMMKQEFKKILADTQDKYEKELREEREFRENYTNRILNE